MFLYYKDNFDSTILRKNVFKLLLDKNLGSKKIPNLIKDNEKPGIIFCFSVFSNQNINILEKFGFNFISIRNTYSYKRVLPAAKPQLSKEFRVFFSANIPDLDKKSVSDLARTIGRTSRYFKDSLIPRKAALGIYKQWLANSLYHGYADECISITKGNELVGLVTLKIKNNEGIIDLIGVRNNFQKLGLGTFLLSSALEFFKRHNVEKISVITEGENIAANAFYQKTGFIIKDTQLVFHKHY